MMSWESSIDDLKLLFAQNVHNTYLHWNDNQNISFFKVIDIKHNIIN